MLRTRKVGTKNKTPFSSRGGGVRDAFQRSTAALRNLYTGTKKLSRDGLQQLTTFYKFLSEKFSVMKTLRQMCVSLIVIDLYLLMVPPTYTTLFCSLAISFTHKLLGTYSPLFKVADMARSMFKGRRFAEVKSSRENVNEVATQAAAEVGSQLPYLVDNIFPDNAPIGLKYLARALEVLSYILVIFFSMVIIEYFVDESMQNVRKLRFNEQVANAIGTLWKSLQRIIPSLNQISYTPLVSDSSQSPPTVFGGIFKPLYYSGVMNLLGNSVLLSSISSIFSDAKTTQEEQSSLDEDFE